MDAIERLMGNRPLIWGRNAVVGTTWEELYSYDQPLDWPTILPAAAKVDVTSSSAADASAGTGARTIELVGLDGNYKFQSEILSMNGNTIVVSALFYLRLFSADVKTAGTGGTNAGDIHIVKTGTGGTYTAGVPGTVTSALLKVLAGYGSGMSGIFTTPAGTGYMLQSIIAGCRTQAGVLGVFKQDLGAAGALKIVHGIDMGASTSTFYDLEWCGQIITFKEKTDIRLRGIGAAASAVMSATMGLRKTDG